MNVSATAYVTFTGVVCSCWDVKLEAGRPIVISTKPRRPGEFGYGGKKVDVASS